MEEKNHIDEYDGSNDEYTLCTNGVFPIGNTQHKQRWAHNLYFVLYK